jgi:hypothetical protein
MIISETKELSVNKINRRQRGRLTEPGRYALRGRLAGGAIGGTPNITRLGNIVEKPARRSASCEEPEASGDEQGHGLEMTR